MKKLIAMVCFMMAATPLAFAQDKAKDDAKKAAPVAEVKADKGKDAEKAKKERTPAQKANDARLKDCNADAGDKKGEERKKFMSACMKDKQKAQQSKMTSCNKEAGDKKVKGDERKAFMKDCLSAKPAAAPAPAAQPAQPEKK